MLVSMLKIRFLPFFEKSVSRGVVGKGMGLSEILGSLKRDLKGKKCWNTTRQLNAPERAQVGGQLFQWCTSTDF